MSSVRLLTPAVNLLDVIIDSLHPDGKDYSSDIIVFPGKRPAHVLRKKLAEKIGGVFVPPQMYSIDQFINVLCSKFSGYPEQLIGELDAVALLFDIHLAMTEKERMGKKHFSTLDTFYPVGVKIISELEELMISGITPEQLSASVAPVTLDAAHALASLYQPFYEKLKERGFTSRALNYRFLADSVNEIDLAPHRSVTLAGFFAFTPTEETIVRHLSGLDNVYFFFQQGRGIEGTLKRMGVHAEAEGPEASPKHYFYESPDSHGQIFLLNRVIADTISHPVTASDAAAIILPSSENLFPLYHQTLSHLDQSTYNLALGYPLTRTPVYGFLVSLLDVIVTMREGEVFIPSYMQFLLHPYTKNILYKTRTDVTRTLVHAIEDDCLEHSARMYLSPAGIMQSPGIMEKAMRRLQNEEVEITIEELQVHLEGIHRSTIQPLTDIPTVGTFASVCIDVLNYINERSTAHRHPYFHPFLHTLMDHLFTLRQSLLARYSFEQQQHYLFFLKHYIASAEVPFTGTPLQGLQVLGFLETRGLNFEHVFVIDANDDVIPGKSQQDVLLPVTIREELGLPTYRDQERIKSYLFDLLRLGASSVHFFYVNNAEKEASRFIAELQWKQQLNSASLTPQNTSSQEYGIDLVSHLPEPIVKNEEMTAKLKEMPLSSTAIDTYMTCGLRFYYRYLLRLKEKREVSGDVDQSDIGKIVHAILCDYVSTMKGRPLQPSDFDSVRLESVIRDSFHSFYGKTQVGEQFITRRQVERQLKRFFEEYQIPIASSSTIVVNGVEEKLYGDVEGHQLTGFADRIETRNDRTVIMDYKTGKSESNYRIRFDALREDDRSTWHDAIGTVQLALYVMVYSAVHNVPPETVDARFLFLGKKDLNDSIELPLFESEDEMKRWYPLLKKIIIGLAAEIKNPDIPFTPTGDVKNDCPDCAFKIICGTQWTEKYSPW